MKWGAWAALLVGTATSLPASAWAATGELSSTGIASLIVALALLAAPFALLARQVRDDLRARRKGRWYAEEDVFGQRRVVRVSPTALPHRSRDATVVAWGYFSNELEATTRELVGQAPPRLPAATRPRSTSAARQRRRGAVRGSSFLRRRSRASSSGHATAG